MARFRRRKRVEAPEPDPDFPARGSTSRATWSRRPRPTTPTARDDLRRPRGHHRSTHVQRDRERRNSLGSYFRSRGLLPGDRVLVFVGKSRLARRHARRDQGGLVAVPCSEILRAGDIEFRVATRARGSLSPTASGHGAREDRGHRSAVSVVEALKDELRTCPSADRARHGRRGHRLDPLHLRHDEGAEGRRPQPWVHVDAAAPGGALADGARRPRLVHRGDGLGEVDLERPPRPVVVRGGDRDPRRSLRRAGAPRPHPAARCDGPLPDSDRVPDDGQAARAGALLPGGSATPYRPASRSIPR